MEMLCPPPWLLLQTSSGISTLRLATSAAGQRAGPGLPGGICDVLEAQPGTEDVQGGCAAGRASSAQFSLLAVAVTFGRSLMCFVWLDLFCAVFEGCWLWGKGFPSHHAILSSSWE